MAKQTGGGRSQRGAALAGAGSLSIAGTGRVNRIVNSVLRDDPWARDAANLRGDFSRAMAKVDRGRGRNRG